MIEMSKHQRYYLKLSGSKLFLGVYGLHTGLNNALCVLRATPQRPTNYELFDELKAMHMIKWLDDFEPANFEVYSQNDKSS